MHKQKRKATFSLPVVLLNRYREYAAGRDIPSMTAGVQAAMEAYAKKIEKEKLCREMREASNDTLFMEDLQETMQAFYAADRETVKGIPE